MKKILASVSHSIRQIGLMFFVLSLAFLSLVAVSYVRGWTDRGWTEPTQTPPGGNASPPINVSAASQYKSGALGVGGLFYGYADALFNGQVNVAGGLCLNGDCKTSWDQAGTTAERIVQKVTRPDGSLSGTTYPTDEVYQCTRQDALNNYTTEIFYGTTAVHWLRIECSLEYTKDSGNSIQIEINDPSNATWECADYNLQDYCGDDDGCRVDYYGQWKLGDDSVRSVSNFMSMETPSFSKNNAVGIYGHTQVGSGEYNWINGDGTADTILNLWNWSYLVNNYHSYCGGNNTAISNPYVFRFLNHPQIHAKFIIYDKP